MVPSTPQHSIDVVEQELHRCHGYPPVEVAKIFVQPPTSRPRRSTKWAALEICSNHGLWRRSWWLWQAVAMGERWEWRRRSDGVVVVVGFVEGLAVAGRERMLVDFAFEDDFCF
jgi:hypothetical protein